MSYLTKLKGSPAPIPPRPPLKDLGFISLGAFLAACVIGYLAYLTNQPIIMGSFGASIFVLFVLRSTKKCNFRPSINNFYWPFFLSFSGFRLVEYGPSIGNCYCSNAIP